MSTKRTGKHDDTGYDNNDDDDDDVEIGDDETRGLAKKPAAKKTPAFGEPRAFVTVSELLTDKAVFAEYDDPATTALRTQLEGFLLNICKTKQSNKKAAMSSDAQMTRGLAPRPREPAAEAEPVSMLPPLRGRRSAKVSAAKFVNGSFGTGEDGSLLLHPSTGEEDRKAFRERVYQALPHGWEPTTPLPLHVAHAHRLKFQLGWSLFSAAINGVLLSLMMAKDGIGGSFLVSFTTSTSRSMWNDSPSGRSWPALTTLSIILFVLTGVQLAVYAFYLCACRVIEARFNRGLPPRTQTARQRVLFSRQWQLHDFFWYTTAACDATMVVVACVAAGQVELVGMAGAALMVFLCGMSYSLLHPYAGRVACYTHWAYVSALLVSLLALAMSVTIDSMHKAVFYGWWTQYLLKHVAWHTAVSNLHFFYLVSPTPYTRLYTAELQKTVDRVAKTPIDSDQVYQFAGCRMGVLHRLLPAGMRNNIATPFGPFTRAIDANSAWIAKRVISDTGGGTDVLPRAEAERALPHRALLKRISVMLAALYIVFFVVSVVLFGTGVSSQHYHARNNQQYVHGTVATGLWPVLFLVVSIPPLLYAGLSAYSNYRFKEYLKEVLFHGVYNTRFVVLAVTDIFHVALIAAAVGVTDTLEMITLCGVCSMAHWINSTWTRDNEHDMRFLSMISHAASWLALLLRSWANDGDVIADRGRRLFLAAFAFGAHVTEAIIGALAVHWLGPKRPATALRVEIAWQLIRLAASIVFPLLVWQFELLETR